MLRHRLPCSSWQSCFRAAYNNEALSRVAVRVSDPDRSPLDSSPAIRVLPWKNWQQRQSQERDGEFPNAEQAIVCPLTSVASQLLRDE
jgi:hypothetical protein